MKILLICGLILLGVAPHRAEDEDEGGFLDMAANFLNDYNNNNQEQGQGSAGGFLEMASMLGNMMNAGGDGGGKSQSGVADLLAGLGNLMGGKKKGGIDPKLIGNFIDFLTGKAFDDIRKPGDPELVTPMDTILDVVSVMLSARKNKPIEYEQPKKANQGPPRPKRDYEGLDLDSFLDMVPVLMDSFTPYLGTSLKSIQDKHREHAGSLPPFLERVHQLWDQVSESEIGKGLFEKLGLKLLFKVGIS